MVTSRVVLTWLSSLARPFNPVTIGSWPGAGLLFLFALPSAGLVYETLSDR